MLFPNDIVLNALALLRPGQDCLLTSFLRSCVSGLQRGRIKPTAMLVASRVGQMADNSIKSQQEALEQQLEALSLQAGDRTDERAALLMDLAELAQVGP
jgi:hypothetical protein